MAKDIINIPHLIQGCLEGDRVCQLRLYEHFYGYGMGICLRYTSNREEALEVLNDGFLKVFTKIKLYNPAYAFKPWLRKVLINAAIDYHRKYDKLIDTGGLTPIIESKNTTYNLGVDNLAYEDLLKVIQQLTPVYKLVFNLYVIEGCTHKEIAEKLNIGIGTSKSNLAKARAKVRGLLNESHGIYHKSK